MEMKDIHELEGMDPEELREEEKKLQKELFHLRFQLMNGRVENPMRIRQARHEIARIQTVLRRKQIQAEKGQAGQGQQT